MPTCNYMDLLLSYTDLLVELDSHAHSVQKDADEDGIHEVVTVHQCTCTHTSCNYKHHKLIILLQNISEKLL